jgi:hypothetical protein
MSFEKPFPSTFDWSDCIDCELDGIKFTARIEPDMDLSPSSSQSIDGAKLYPFKRVTRPTIGEILNRDNNHITRWFL